MKIREIGIAHMMTPGKAFALVRKNKKDMIRFPYLGLCLIAVAMVFSSCQAIEGIFKAGFWTAIILIIIVVGIILWLVSRSRR